MKKILFVIPFIILITKNTCAQKKEQIQVAKAVENLRKAMVDADSLMLDALAQDDLSYGHSGGAVDNKQIFIQKIVSGKSDFVTIDLEDQSILINKKAAIVRHILNAKTNDNGKQGEVHLKVMLVWQKKNGKWKLLARQAVKI